MINSINFIENSFLLNKKKRISFTGKEKAAQKGLQKVADEVVKIENLKAPKTITEAKKSFQRVLLCIMDGLGINPKTTDPYDATRLAKMTNLEKLKKEGAYTSLRADGEYVGLPEGQMGNSEVGHLNIGAGRVVYQELTRINKSIREGTFFKNERFLTAIKHAKENNSSFHIYGLVSDGGVHSSMEHISALIKLVSEQGLKRVYVHAFLDGRDTSPQSACKYLEQIEKELKAHNLPPIASISGRYYAMDRDSNWNRIEQAYNCLLVGKSEGKSAIGAVNASYKQGINDEFVLPRAIGGEESRIKDNDSIIFFNFRPDRAREITRAVTSENFNGFTRQAVRKNLYYVTMTQYDETFKLPIAFPPQKLTNILGDVLDQNSVNQFRTAETEKYAHVTFFFNGGIEKPNKLEKRALVPSPKVATYDLKPEMSADEVCENVLKAEESPENSFILVNFANPDMVGHTGNVEAATKACKVVDECVEKIAKRAEENNITMLITADHGNAEVMKNGTKPNTAHTTNPVPFIIVNGKQPLRNGGALCDIAPTILDLMGIKKPAEMTGKSLILNG